MYAFVFETTFAHITFISLSNNLILLLSLRFACVVAKVICVYILLSRSTAYMCVACRTYIICQRRIISCFTSYAAHTGCDFNM